MGSYLDDSSSGLSISDSWRTRLTWLLTTARSMSWKPSVCCPDHLAVDDGLFETLVQRIHWLLGEKVEIETYAKEDGMHIVLKDMDYGMDGELFNMKEEDE